MKGSPTVSVIIPAYKHAHLIGATIDSVLEQGHADWEMIVINDGSPDDTAAAVAPYLGDPRIRYLEQENQGQSATRNHGIGLARGEWIQLLDDDDLLAPESLSWKVEFLETHPGYCCVVGAVRYIDGEDKPGSDWQGTDGEIQLRALFRESAFASPGQALFRKADLVAIGGFDPTIPGVDDADLMFRLAAHGRIMAVNRPALLYRWHGANASLARHRMLPMIDRVQQRHLPKVTPLRARMGARFDALQSLHRYAGVKSLGIAMDPAMPGNERSAAIRSYLRIFPKRLMLFPLFLPWWCEDIARFLLRRFQEWRSRPAGP